MQGNKWKKPTILTLSSLLPPSSPHRHMSQSSLTTRREPDPGNFKQPCRSSPSTLTHLTMAQTTPNAGCVHSWFYLLDSSPAKIVSFKEESRVRVFKILIQIY